jgi:tRNA dimethylallyltransferase
VVQKGPVKPKVVILCGPTGVGKTEVALRLAEAIGGELVVADSQAVLKGFDIGTAKPGPEERARVPHHLIDVVDFGDPFDAARFADLADRAVEEIRRRRRVPIVSGGTGLYLKAFLFGLMDAPRRDETFRKVLEERAERDGLAALYEELKKVDPVRAAEIHPNDAVRIIRALEIHRLGGKSPSSLQENHRFREPRYDALKIGLKRSTEELRRRIDNRVLAMLNHGWMEEVRRLMERGADLIHGKTQTLGYPTLARVAVGEMFLKDAIGEIQKETRRLAKRQMTWFRADPEIRWFHPDQWEEILMCVQRFLADA